MCGKRTEHRFEIYYRNGTIPKQREVPYFHAANLPSKMLISTTEKEWAAKAKSIKAKPRVGALGPFYSQQFGLQSIANGKIGWSLGTLGPEIYYEDLFEGIDYLALEGASGFSRREGWIKSGSKRFVITAQKPKDDRKYSQTPLNEFALIIELPQSMTDRIIANDQARGINLKAMSQQAMPPAKPASR